MCVFWAKVLTRKLHQTEHALDSLSRKRNKKALRMH
jgi:hypothetical protein